MAGTLKQQALFIVARSDTRFVKETLRRGGPYEVMGKRWKRKSKASLPPRENDLSAVLPKLGRMR